MHVCTKRNCPCISTLMGTPSPLRPRPPCHSSYQSLSAQLLCEITPRGASDRLSEVTSQGHCHVSNVSFPLNLVVFRCWDDVETFCPLLLLTADTEGVLSLLTAEDNHVQSDFSISLSLLLPSVTASHKQGFLNIWSNRKYLNTSLDVIPYFGALSSQDGLRLTTS